MKRLILFTLFVLFLTSCVSQDGKSNSYHEDVVSDNAVNYWYWYKSITYGEGHGGTFTATKTYSIGDQICVEGEIIEVASEKHVLKD